MRKISVGVLLVLWVFLLGVVGIRPSQAADDIVENVTSVAPTAASAIATTSGCVTDWYVSYGGVTQFQLLWSDPDGLPVDQLRFDWGYHDPYEYASGYIDFNGNRKSDIFSAVPRSDGSLQWRYWDTTTSGWVNLGYAYDPLNGLRFGDFNKDNKTDVFSTALRNDGNYQWRYSSGGTANYTNLNYSSLPIESLRFGDFNADGYTDVFAALPQAGGGTYNWVYSPSGVGAFQTFSTGEEYDTPGMLFGDTQPDSAQGSGSDGITDMLIMLPNGSIFSGDPQYVWRSRVVAHYLPASGGVDPTALQVGNFDGDYYTDIFYQQYDPVTKLYLWRYISGADYTIHALNSSTTPVSGLRFGDFNGDGLTDVFLAATPSCSVYLPLIVR